MTLRLLDWKAVLHSRRPEPAPESDVAPRGHARPPLSWRSKRRRQPSSASPKEPSSLDRDLLAILEGVPIDVWTCDTNMRVTQLAYSSTNKDPARYVGHTDFDWLPEKEAEAKMALERRAIETGKPVRGRYNRLRDDKLYEVDFVVLPKLDAEGRAESITCFAVDVGEEIESLLEFGFPGTPPVDLGFSLSGPQLRRAFRTLISRFQRREPAEPEASRLIGNVRVDPMLRRLVGPSRGVRLSRTEWLVLHELLENPGEVMPHETLLERVWGPDYVHEAHLLHDTVSRVRQRLRTVGAKRNVIQTVHGVGYRLVEPANNARGVLGAIGSLLLLHAAGLA